MGMSIRPSGKLSAETWKARKKCNDIYKVLKEKKPVNQEYSTQQNFPPKMKKR